jgi:hypothetical protein
VVDLPLTSIFCNGSPRNGSRFTVLVLPVASWMVVWVAAAPEAGEKVVMTFRFRASAVEVSRPYWS